MPSIDGILNRFKDEKVGVAIGFALTEMQLARRRSTSFINNIEMQIADLMSQPHIPDLGHVLDELMNPNATPFMPAVMAAVLGYFMEEIDIFPQVRQLGSFMKSLGTSIAIGAAGTTIFDKATHSYSEGGADGSTGGGYHQLYIKPQPNHAGHHTMPNVAPTRNIGTIVAGVPHP